MNNTGYKYTDDSDIYDNDNVVYNLYDKKSKKGTIIYGEYQIKCCGCCFNFHDEIGYHILTEDGDNISIRDAHIINKDIKTDG